MLDDVNVLKQRDPEDALGVATNLWRQATYEVALENTDHDNRPIKKVVVAGMGGSALAADLAKTMLRQSLDVSYEVVKGYELPHYVDAETLVIASSHSGNTEETVSCFEEALHKTDTPQLAVIATGGTLVDLAKEHDVLYAQPPHDTQPRMGTIYMLRCLLAVLADFKVIGHDRYHEVAEAATWLQEASDAWAKDMPTERNYAKQLALLTVGKTPVFYGGSVMAPLAYKWKISWNENAKNTAFWNYLPEFNHNEFIGWTSHPVEKPFAVFDLVSDHEHPRVLNGSN